MINNYELIKNYMEFPNKRAFYFVQILRRKKDNPEQKSYHRPIESFYIRDLGQFERMMPHIIEKCEQNRARAYVKMNPLDARKVMLRQISIISQNIGKEKWSQMASSFNSACGQGGIIEKGEEDTEAYSMADVHINGFDKLHLIDVDNISDNADENLQYRKEMKDFINSLPPLVNKETGEKIENKIRIEVPTKSGYHFLCTGFDMREFRKKYSGVDVHKEGNTILYIPDCIS